MNGPTPSSGQQCCVDTAASQTHGDLPTNNENSNINFLNPQGALPSDNPLVDDSGSLSFKLRILTLEYIGNVGFKSIQGNDLQIA